MICVSCRHRHHEDCRGGSWCDCQHLPPQRQPGTGAAEAPAETALSWVRQG